MNLRTTLLLFVLHLNYEVNGDKWRLSKSSDYLKKKMTEMDKNKMKTSEIFAKKKPFIKSNLKINTKKTSVINKLEPASVNEREQLCLSVSEDSVKESLLKLAMITHLIEDVGQFRQQIKALKDSIPKSHTSKKRNRGTNAPYNLERQMQRQKGGQKVKLSQGNYVGRSLGGMSAPSLVRYQGEYMDGSNQITRQAVAHPVARWKREITSRSKREDGSYIKAMKRADRRKGTGKNFGQVPTCYGWRYLSALEALQPDSSPDTQVLEESLSDMGSVGFADSIIAIINTCGAKVAKARMPPMCPPPPPPQLIYSGGNPGGSGEVVSPCMEQCMINTDCGEGELCCRNSCGGFQCINPGVSKAKPCQMADSFMQCLYDQTDSQLCE